MTANFSLAVFFALAFVARPLAAAKAWPECEAPPFSGNDQVKALNSTFITAYHKLMLENESREGRIAYCLSLSSMDKSGLSFGVSQFDLRTNPAAWPALRIILTAVEKSEPYGSALKLTPLENKAVELKLAFPDAPNGNTLIDPSKRSVELDSAIRKINDSLKTPTGMNLINDLTIRHLKSIGTIDENLRNQLSTKSKVFAGKLLNTSIASRLYIQDYSNLFDGINDTMLPLLLNGQAQYPKSNTRISITSDRANFSDMIRLALGTDQGKKCQVDGRSEVLRRIKNVVVIARESGETIPQTAIDRKYFSGELRKIIDSPCVSKHRGSPDDHAALLTTSD